MTDERQTTDSGAVDDRLVSETYRQTAAERAPEHLDAAVLRMAAKAARPRYTILRAWTRPVAWAAVVMLSVTLVLELNRTPVPPTAEKDLLAPGVLPETRLEERVDDVAPDPAKREQERRDVQELKVMDTDMLQQAEDMARMRQGADTEPLLAAPAAAEPASMAAEEEALQAVMPLPEKSAMRSAASVVDTEPGCDESTRADAHAWLACITALEEAGQSELARTERELLQTAFPGFPDQ